MVAPLPCPNGRCKALNGAHCSVAFCRGVRTMRFSSRLGRFLAAIVVAPAIAGGAVAFVLAPDARLPVALVTAGIALLALIASVVLSHAVNSRLATFVEAMRRLSHADFRPIAPLPKDDEFAELAGEFNEMSA